MRKNKLINALHSPVDEEVIVKVENGLYYPIQQVIRKDDKIILLCKDISKVER